MGTPELTETDVLSSCSASKLVEVKKLSAIKKNIHGIEVLRKCSALERVELTKNEIEDASALRKLKKLSWLSLANNRLTTMDFVEKLTNLTVLNLSYNQIRDMSPLKSLRELSALILSGNCITEVNGLESMTRLNTLVLSQNSIRAIDVTYLGSLVKLQMSHNQLSKFPNVKFNEDLKQLSLNDNLIESVPSDYLSDNSLEIVNLGKNKIKKFKQIKPLKQLSTLKQLNLKGNEICECEGYVKKMLAIFPGLKTFDSEPIERLKEKLNMNKEEQKLPDMAKKRLAPESPIEDNPNEAMSPDIGSLKKQKKHHGSAKEAVSPDEESLSNKKKGDLQDGNRMTKYTEKHKKKSKKEKMKETKTQSGVIAVKEIKPRKLSLIKQDVFSAFEVDVIGQGEKSAW